MNVFAIESNKLDEYSRKIKSSLNKTIFYRDQNSPLKNVNKLLNSIMTLSAEIFLGNRHVLRFLHRM